MLFADPDCFELSSSKLMNKTDITKTEYKFFLLLSDTQTCLISSLNYVHNDKLKIQFLLKARI